jgi:hypothetical protein
MTELRRSAKRRPAGHRFLARRLRQSGRDRVKGEEKCQDAARLKPPSARTMFIRFIRKTLKKQD